MNEKSITKKIITTVAILASVMIVFLQLRFMMQNLYFVYALQTKVTNIGASIAKISVMVALGISLFINNTILHFLDVNKKQIHVRRMMISNLVLIALTLILSIVFLITESKEIAPKFVIPDVANQEASRSLKYFFYESKKFVIIFVLSVILAIASFLPNAKTTLEKKGQSWIYSFSIIAIFLNIMFLMVTVLDLFKSNYGYLENKAFLISLVILSIIAFIVGFFHLFVGIIQRRALANDKLDTKKIANAGLSFLVIEAVLQLVILIMFNVLFKELVTFYITIFFSEFFFVGLLFSLSYISSIKFSQDERLVFERKERLEHEKQLNESDVLKF